MNHRFLQGEFLAPMAFVGFLKKHGIRIDEKILEKYESEGWIQPAFRIVIPRQLQNGTLLLANENIRELYKDGLIELPKVRDYEPWRNFRADYKKGVRRDKKLMYYHSFQFLQVKNIFANKEFCFTYFDSYKKCDLEKIMSHAETWKKIRGKQFNTSLLGQVKNIGLLMLLEEPYRFQAFGSISLPARRNDDSFESWMRWKKKFFAEKLLKDSGFSIEQTRTLHSNLITQASFLDPLRNWYDLIRIMKRTEIKKLKGDALTAQLYYNIINMIALFLYDLTGETTKEPDIFFDGTNGEWKKNVYSNPFDYGTRKTQRGIMSKFVAEPTTRLYLLVEGDTEEKVIGKIFVSLGISMTDDGINVINCKGVANISKNKLDWIIRSANRDYIAVYVIADNETSLQSIKNIQKDVRTKFSYHMWNTSFEEDNFGKKK